MATSQCLNALTHTTGLDTTGAGERERGGEKEKESDREGERGREGGPGEDTD